MNSTGNQSYQSLANAQVLQLLLSLCGVVDVVVDVVAVDMMPLNGFSSLPELENLINKCKSYPRSNLIFRLA